MKRLFSLSLSICIILLLMSICGCGSSSAQEHENTPPPQSMINHDDDDISSDLNIDAPTYDISTPTDKNPPSKSPPMTAKQLKGAEDILDLASESGINAVDAKLIFKLHCAVCHGFNGNANVNGATDLTKSRISLTESVAHINYGRGLMTPYNVLLSKEEIIAVARYSHSLR